MDRLMNRFTPWLYVAWFPFALFSTVVHVVDGNALWAALWGAMTAFALDWAIEAIFDLKEHRRENR